MSGGGFGRGSWTTSGTGTSTAGRGRTVWGSQGTTRTGTTTYGSTTSTYGTRSSYSTRTTMSGAAIKLDNLPPGIISDVDFAFMNNYIAVSSWGGQVKVYEMNDTFSAAALIFTYVDGKEQPILRCAFDATETGILVANARGEIIDIKMEDKKETLIGQHAGPIIGMKYNYSNRYIISVGLDKKLKFFLESSPKEPMKEVDLPDKPVCLDVAGDFVVVALANKSVVYYYLPEMNRPKTITYQHILTSIRILPDGSGFVVGTANGALHVYRANTPAHPTEDKKELMAHKVTDGNKYQIYASNCLAIHPHKPVVASGGGDGSIIFYEVAIGKKNKEKKNDKTLPITALQFSPNGMMLAVGFGYDWAQGNPTATTKKDVSFTILKVTADEVGR